MMRTRPSLRLKVALAFSALTIVLLIAQALGVKALAETQEEKFIDAVIADDMRNLMQSYRADSRLVPPLDQRLGGRVSQERGLHVALPATVRKLQDGTHEIILDGREIHVAIAVFAGERLYRVYDFSAYERHFKHAINLLMVGTGLFALLTIWLAFGLSGALVRQIAGLARQVRTLRLGAATALNPGKYDEIEVVELAEIFNEYHRRMAGMIEREKEFTGNVSHELRTPLTTIKTSCELLEQDAAIDPKSKARIQQIERATDSMIEAVNALLLLARDESFAQSESVRLADAIADAVDRFADVLAVRNIEVVINCGSELQIEANRSALAIVLSNLIENAVRHTHSGHIRFFYEKGELHIQDTGTGIPPEALPQVFERSYRATPTGNDSCGLGLGLAIVKKICDRHTWSIRIESGLGKGTCVSIRLPLCSTDSAGFTNI